MFKDIKTIDVKPQLASSVEVRHTGAITGYSYFNATGVDIYVTTRNGIITKLDPTYLNNESGNLIIRSNLIFDNEENVNVPTDSPEEDVLKVYYDSFANSNEYRYSGKRSLHYDNVVTLEQLKESDGSIYLRNLDLLVSLNKSIDINIHPFSSAANTRRLLQRLKDEKTEHTNFSIKIIDNESILTTQYVKIADTVHAITPVKDLKSKDGVYILENKLVKGPNEESIKNVKYAPIERHRSDYKSYREPLIFNRYEDAFNFKDVLEIERLKTERADNDFKKKEMKYREREIELRQRERERDIAFKGVENKFKENELEFKERILELERERRVEEEKIDSLRRKHQMEITIEKNRLAELELRLKENQSRAAEKELKHKEELLMIKENYEKRSVARKNTSDLIRAVPVVVTGIAAIAGLIYGRNNNS